MWTKSTECRLFRRLRRHSLVAALQRSSPSGESGGTNQFAFTRLAPERYISLHLAKDEKFYSRVVIYFQHPALPMASSS